MLVLYLDHNVGCGMSCFNLPIFNNIKYVIMSDKKLIIRGILLISIGVLSTRGLLPDVGINISDVCLIGLGLGFISKYFKIS